MQRALVKEWLSHDEDDETDEEEQWEEDDEACKAITTDMIGVRSQKVF